MSDTPWNIASFTFVILTAEPDATVAFWRDVLGGSVESTSSSEMGEMTILEVGPGRIEVLGVAAERAPAPARSTQVALSVDDVDGWHAQLVASGAPIAYGPVAHEGGGASLGTTDPNGVLVSFFKPPPGS